MAGAPGIPRTWETLFGHALKIIGEIAKHGRDDPFWTFGGGTVLTPSGFHIRGDFGIVALVACVIAFLQALIVLYLVVLVRFVCLSAVSDERGPKANRCFCQSTKVSRLADIRLSIVLDSLGHL